MKKLLTELGNLLGTSSDAYKIIRRRIFKVLGLIFAASLLAVTLNFWGLKTANAIIGCILPFVALYLFTSPEVIGGVFLAGLITSPKHPVAGIKGVAELVGQALAWIVLVASLFFLIVGTLPLGRNFGAVGVVYLCFGILLLMDIRNIKKTKFAMRLLYTYAIVALVVSLGSMIPCPVHVKMYGHDLFSWLRISPVERAIARVEDAETKVNEKKVATALAVIEKKILKGQALTTNELSLKANAKALRDGNTAPAGAKKTWNGVFAKTPPTPPPPRDLGWQRWEVKPTNNTVVRVYNGDEFIYKSPMAFRVSEAGGTDHLHNPSTNPEEIRSFRFYDLPAQGREIKILPVDGTNVFWLDFRIETGRTS